MVEQTINGTYSSNADRRDGERKKNGHKAGEYKEYKAANTCATMYTAE